MSKSTTQPSKQFQIYFLALTGIDTLVWLFLAYSYGAFSLKWSTSEISLLQPLQGYISDIPMMWFVGLAALLTLGALSFVYYIGLRRVSNSIRIMLIILFLIVEVLGLTDTTIGSRSGYYVWTDTYAYSGFTYFNTNWGIANFIISSMNTKDEHGNQTADGIYIALALTAFFISFFPKGWIVSQVMILTMMYWISWSNDIFPWILQKLRRTYE